MKFYLLLYPDVNTVATSARQEQLPLMALHVVDIVLAVSLVRSR
jgi:hypothetical protein